MAGRCEITYKARRWIWNNLWQYMRTKVMNNGHETLRVSYDDFIAFLSKKYGEEVNSKDVFLESKFRELLERKLSPAIIFYKNGEYVLDSKKTELLVSIWRLTDNLIKIDSNIYTEVRK